jgi:hypothetical protein
MQMIITTRAITIIVASFFAVPALAEDPQQGKPFTMDPGKPFAIDPPFAPRSCLLMKGGGRVVAAWPERTDGTCWAQDGPKEPPPMPPPLKPMPAPAEKGEHGPR